MSFQAVSNGVTTSKYTITDQRYCIGSTSDIVTVRAIYPMPAYLSVLTATNITNVARSTDNLSSNTLDGKYAHLIDAVTVFRNEPFPSQTVNTANCTFP